MNVIKFQHFMTKWQMRVSLHQLCHPILVVTEAGAVVVQVLVNATLQLVNELLLGETVNLFRYERGVATKRGNETAGETIRLNVFTEVQTVLAHKPALLHHLLNLLGEGHHHQTGTVQKVTHLFPREGLSRLDEHGHHHNLDVAQTQFATEVGEGVLHRRPELI